MPNIYNCWLNTDKYQPHVEDGQYLFLCDVLIPDVNISSLKAIYDCNTDIFYPVNYKTIQKVESFNIRDVKISEKDVLKAIKLFR